MEGKSEENKSEGAVENPDPAKSQVERRQGDSLPVRSYLDQTVVPLLIQALSELAKERL